MAYPEDRPMSEDDFMAKAREPRRSGLPLPEQEKVISELQDVVRLLIDKLQPVLTPTEPTEKAGDAVPAPIQSEVAATIGDNNSRLRRVIRQVSNTIERLEV